MTPSKQLERRLNSSLAPHGMKIVGELDWPRGAQRRMDTCRWSASVGFRDNDGRARGVWSMASWSTIRDCLRYGFEIKFRKPRSEANIMVEAKL